MKKLKQKISHAFNNKSNDDELEVKMRNYCFNDSIPNAIPPTVGDSNSRINYSNNHHNNNKHNNNNSLHKPFPVDFSADQYGNAGKYNHYSERYGKSNGFYDNVVPAFISDALSLAPLQQPQQQQNNGKPYPHKKQQQQQAQHEQHLETPSKNLTVPTAPSAAALFGGSGPGSGSEARVLKHRACSLSDSISHLAERLAADGVIVEEYQPGVGAGSSSFQANSLNPRPNHRSRPMSIACAGFSAFNAFFRSASNTDGKSTNAFDEPFVMLRQKSASKKVKRRGKNRVKSWHASQLTSQIPPAVVHEAKALGSDGESLEVSPCTSDQLSSSPFYRSTYGDSQQQRCYVPNVKMRQKPPTRRWSEQDIQKRLSLPADIKLPQTVVEKLNRTPTLDNPLTRKSRRASLSEIGFGKLETYKKLLDLGEGTYATVYLGKSLLTEKSVALKEIRLNHEEGAPCTAIREVSLLRNLRHANVVTLHDVIYTDRTLTLVFEFLDRDLREYMEELGGFICINNVKLFMIQLLRGLAYCHKRRILHRDLKPQNLLINRIGELKLADFGLARAQSVPTKTYSNEVVTLWYRPPDVLLGSTDYSTHIDMWGIGCIFYELLANRALFAGSTTDEQLNLIFQRFGTPTMEYDPALCSLPLFKMFNFKKYPYPLNFHLKMYNPPRITSECTELLQKLLRYDGRLRISAVEAMRTSFFADFPQAEIFRLPDTQSVLSLPGVSYVPELNSRRNMASP